MQLSEYRSGERVRAVNTSTCSKTSLVPVCFSPEVGSLCRWLLPQINAEAVERVLSTWVRATSLAYRDPVPDTARDQCRKYKRE